METAALNHKRRAIDLLLILCLLISLVREVLHGYRSSGWEYSDWLVNYEAGFVRRGLPGEILLLLSRHGVQPYRTILFLSLLLLGVAILWLTILGLRKDFPIGLLVGPFALGAPILGDYWVTKDFLLVVLLLSALSVRKKKGLTGFIFTNLILVAAILSHEVFLFVGLPCLFALKFDANSKSCESDGHFPSVWKTSGKNCLFFSPTLVAVCACVVLHGAPSMVSTIWSSWQHANIPGFELHQPSGEVLAMGWSLRYGIELPMRSLTEFSHGVYVPLAWLLLFATAYQLSVLILAPYPLDLPPTNGEDRVGNLKSLMRFQLLAICPLFIVGCDFGRWLFFWIVTSFIVYLAWSEDEYACLRGTHRFFRTPSSVDLRDRTFSRLRSFATARPLLCYACLLFYGVPSTIWTVERSLQAMPILSPYRGAVAVMRSRQNQSSSKSTSIKNHSIDLR
jgi:hypothetical protein